MSSKTSDGTRSARPGRRGMGRRLAVLVSLCLTLIAGAAALILVRGVDGQIEDIARTHEIRQQAQDLAISLIEAESSQRGYLLTLDPGFADHFARAETAISSRLDTLNALVADDEGRAGRLAAIAAEIRRKQAEMSASVTLVATDREEQARLLMQTGSGARLMGEAQVALAQFVAEEDLRLIERNSVMTATRLGLTVAILAAIAAAAVLAYVLVYRSQRQLSDLSARQSLLLSENEVLEAHVRERTEALEVARAHADRERQRVETLLRDTNHRIGNSLATVSSLLGLQVMRAGSEDVRVALEAARDRVQAIASGHRRLRLGADLETARADEFLGAVLEDLASTRSEAGAVALSSDFEPLVINARDATTIGIILGELVTNALKHAFPDGRKGSVRVALRRNPEGRPVLEVEDDGVGPPEPFPEEKKGLGSVIIDQLARQFGGTALREAVEGGGTRVRVDLPELTIAPLNAETAGEGTGAG